MNDSNLPAPDPTAPADFIYKTANDAIKNLARKNR